jgi:hypothetical protein
MKKGNEKWSEMRGDRNYLDETRARREESDNTQEQKNETR